MVLLKLYKVNNRLRGKFVKFVNFEVMNYSTFVLFQILHQGQCPYYPYGVIESILPIPENIRSLLDV